MSIILAEKNVAENIEMRKTYCETLMEMAEQDGRIMVLEADLMAAMGTKSFAQKYPERAVNCGIQEANMYGVAAGLSAVGMVPYAHTFATFCTRRACDQIFMSCVYAKLNVKVIGSDPGIAATFNGGTHMPFEDVGIMRGMPNVTIIEPTDSKVLKNVIKQVADIYGVFYIRVFRRNAIKVYEEGSTFKLGQAVKIKDGKDVTIIASGLCVSEAIEAAKILENKGISARVLDMFTIKPIDKEAIIAAAIETGAIVTAENHNIINGLGSAVAEVLIENSPVPMERVGVQDICGEVGSLDYLKKKFGMTANDIVEKVQKVFKRKE